MSEMSVKIAVKQGRRFWLVCWCICIATSLTYKSVILRTPRLWYCFVIEDRRRVFKIIRIALFCKDCNFLSRSRKCNDTVEGRKLGEDV